MYRPCDARCMYATGEDCECSCGGANHRCGFIGKEEAPSFSPAFKARPFLIPRLIRGKKAQRGNDGLPLFDAKIAHENAQEAAQLTMPLT